MQTLSPVVKGLIKEREINNSASIYPQCCLFRSVTERINFKHIFFVLEQSPEERTFIPGIENDIGRNSSLPSLEVLQELPFRYSTPTIHYDADSFFTGKLVSLIVENLSYWVLTSFTIQ